MASSSPIRTVLIGRGLGGRVFHAPLIGALPAFTLETIAGAAEAEAAATADNIDLVVISTPNASHFPLARAAIAAGKHVVVDKPLTVTTNEADALITLARERGTLLTVFHNRRWDGDFLTVRKLLDEGTLGDPLLMEAHWDRFRPQIKQGWREVAADGAGLLNDLGPHMIDQALCLFGAPRSVSADVLAQRQGAEVDDYFDLTLAYDRLRVRLTASTLVADPRPRFAVHGTAGSFVKYGLDPQEEILKNGGEPNTPGFGRDSNDGMLTLGIEQATVPTETGGYIEFYRGVAAAISEGAPAPVDPEDARQGLRLIELARRSASQGRTLPFKDAS